MANQFSTPLYCKDCLHYVRVVEGPEIGDTYQCHADPSDIRMATDEREPGGLCGPRGIRWVAMPPPPPAG